MLGGDATATKVMLLAAVTQGPRRSGTTPASSSSSIAPIVGGNGGGRPDFAQAGGKDPSRLDEALATIYELVG